MRSAEALTVERLFILLLQEDALDAAVGNEPEKGDKDEKSVRDPRVHKCERDGEEIADGGKFSFPVVADGGSEQGVRTLLLDDGALQDIIGDGRHEKDEAVDRGGHRREMIFADPGGGKRKE